jgi:hypothetical protein
MPLAILGEPMKWRSYPSNVVQDVPRAKRGVIIAAVGRREQ